MASAKRDEVEEIKQKQRISGFNSIFAVSSVPMAKLYYQEFKKQMAADPTKKLRVATIFSYGANEEESDGILDEENSEDTSALDQPSREFLEEAIKDYNELFHTNYDTSSDKFQNYYKDVSLRMKNKELDHVDREILRMLQEDARMSLKDIAEAVFLSSPAVSVRIDNMIEAGYIEGFHATVNPVKMGYHIKAFINLEVSPIDKEQFYPYIKACPNRVQLCDGRLFYAFGSVVP